MLVGPTELWAIHECQCSISILLVVDFTHWPSLCRFFSVRPNPPLAGPVYPLRSPTSSFATYALVAVNVSFCSFTANVTICIFWVGHPTPYGMSEFCRVFSCNQIVFGYWSPTKVGWLVLEEILKTFLEVALLQFWTIYKHQSPTLRPKNPKVLSVWSAILKRVWLYGMWM